MNILVFGRVFREAVHKPVGEARLSPPPPPKEVGCRKYRRSMVSSGLSCTGSQSIFSGRLPPCASGNCMVRCMEMVCSLFVTAKRRNSPCCYLSAKPNGNPAAEASAVSDRSRPVLHVRAPVERRGLVMRCRDVSHPFCSS